MKCSRLVAVLAVCVMLFGAVQLVSVLSAGCAVISVIILIAMCVPSLGYDFSENRKDTPADFNLFLENCTITERIEIMQALQDLPSEYSTAKTETILNAINSDRLDASVVSSEAIRKAIIWRAYNKLTYLFRNDDEIDYHEILQWVAEKLNINGLRVKEYSTFRLEREVAEEYFAKAMEKLTPSERKAISLGIGGLGFGALAACPVPIFDIIELVGHLSSFLLGIIGAEATTISAFIMTVNVIKTRKYAK